MGSFLLALYLEVVNRSIEGCIKGNGIEEILTVEKLRLPVKVFPNMVFNSYCKREKCGLFLELLLASCFFSLFLVLFSVCGSLGCGIYCTNDASVLCHAVDKRSVCLSDTHVRRSAGPGTRQKFDPSLSKSEDFLWLGACAHE